MIAETNELNALGKAKQRQQSQTAIAWRRFKHDKLAVVGAILIIILILTALLAPTLAPYDPTIQHADGLSEMGLPLSSTLPESSQFILGTDALGRDLLSRIIYGSRVSLTVGLLANLVSVVIGTLIGASAAFFGGWAEIVLMRFTEIMMSFPTLLLAIALVAILSPSLWIIILVIGLVYWTGLARVVYGQVLVLKEQEYILAATSLGVRKGRILFRHIMPHLLSTVIVWGTLGIATNVMLEASLSYLGIGVQPPTPSWGQMIQQGQPYYRYAPWMILFPGLAIMITVFAFNLVGDGLRDALDPVQRK